MSKSVTAIVFSRNRPDMLLGVLINNQSAGWITHVIDDDSEFDCSEHKKHCESFTRTDRKGREKFHENFSLAIELAMICHTDLVVFMADDFERLECSRVSDNELTGNYCVNLIHDGRTHNWGAFAWYQIDENFFNANFVDGGFFCPPDTIRRANPILNSATVRASQTSSGIGHALTIAMRAHRIPMYAPVKSYAFHGDHDSQMNFEERKKNPLISIL